MTTKICTGCKKDLPLERFGPKGPRLNSKCKECIAEYYRDYYNSSPERRQAQIRNSAVQSQKHIEKNQIIVLEYLKKHPCPCGESDFMVLEFDHDDPNTKIGNISDMVRGSTRKLKAEMKKCTVRCANCHRRRTNHQLGWWRSLQPAVYPLADNE